MPNTKCVLFVIFPIQNNCVLCIRSGDRIILPRYESELKDGSESRTAALHATMQRGIGYSAREIHLTDTNDYPTVIDGEEAIYHACLAHGCVENGKGAIPVVVIPITEWIEIIKNKNKTDKLSRTVTNSVFEWIAMIKPPSFPRKTKKKAMGKKK